LWPLTMKSSAHARHGPTSTFEKVTARSVGTIPGFVRRNDNGAMERTRAVGKSSIFKRKLLARNGFSLFGNCTAVLSPGRRVDFPIEASRVKVFAVLFEAPKPG